MYICSTSVCENICVLQHLLMLMLFLVLDQALVVLVMRKCCQKKFQSPTKKDVNKYKYACCMLSGLRIIVCVCVCCVCVLCVCVCACVHVRACMCVCVHLHMHGPTCGSFNDGNLHNDKITRSACRK